jgi:hypothetical protein
MSWLKIGNRFSINLEHFEGLKLTDCYELLPEVPKLIVKEAWEKANPKKKK